MLLGTLAMLSSNLATEQGSGKSAYWQVRVPPISTAFIGREEEIQCIVDFVSEEHVTIVSITGGPAYGKSSLAIVTVKCRLMGLGIPVHYISLSEANSI